MLNEIVNALKERRDLAGWTLRHLITRGAQVYAVPHQIESQRAIEVERYRIDVLRQTSGSDGTPRIGSGDATLLPGGDVGAAIEKAALVAGLVANPVHTIPELAPLPDVALIDADLQRDASTATKEMMERIRAAASRNHSVQLTAAECFGEIHTTHLVNSRGIDAEQEATQINIELVLHSQRGENEVETFTELNRRRVADLDLEEEIERQGRYTLDLFEAGLPPSWQGPVLLRGEVLGVFMAGGALGRRSPANARVSLL